MPLDLQVHQFKRKKGQRTAVLQRILPYVNMRVEGKGSIFVQNGKFWTEGDPDPVPEKDVDPAFKALIKDMHPKVKYEVGLISKVQYLQLVGKAEPQDDDVEEDD